MTTCLKTPFSLPLMFHNQAMKILNSYPSLKFSINFLKFRDNCNDVTFSMYLFPNIWCNFWPFKSLYMGPEIFICFSLASHNCVSTPAESLRLYIRACGETPNTDQASSIGASHITPFTNHMFVFKSSVNACLF